MEPIKYYVLGKKDSPLLTEYVEKYYQKLRKYIETFLQMGILGEQGTMLLNENPKTRNFILSPDISSLFQVIYLEKVQNKPQYLGDPDKYIDLLIQEIEKFVSGNEEGLIMSQGHTIMGTNIRLTTYDNNPYNKMEAHPEHHMTGGVLGWGDKTQEEWLVTYEKSFRLLETLDIGIYDELNQIIKKIVPLGTSYSLHNSASYKECIGHLYMGYTVDVGLPEMNILEAIIHESSHNKLNLLMQFDEVILNDKTEKYYSAIRPDARHIHGVFLGIHAFVPTIYILMKAYVEGKLGTDENWLEKIILYHIKNKFMHKVLVKYARLTPLGQEIFKEIEYVMTLIDHLFKKLNPHTLFIQRAKEKQMEHFKSVNTKYPYLEY